MTLLEYTKLKIFYLDCYHEAALLGNEFPVASFGPAGIFSIIALNIYLRNRFTRTEITLNTKGMAPTEYSRWPWNKYENT